MGKTSKKTGFLPLQFLHLLLKLPVTSSARLTSTGVAYFLSSWYKKYEVARRFSIYYTATAVSGAFSGLLAGVITKHLDGARGISGWRWLFIIEGAGATFCGLWAWMILPDYPSTTKFFTPEERLLAAQRLAYDGLANAQGAEGHIGEWAACKLMFKDFRVWVFVVLVCLASDFASIPLISSTCSVPVLRLFNTSYPPSSALLVGLVLPDNTTRSRFTLAPLSSFWPLPSVQITSGINQRSSVVSPWQDVDVSSSVSPRPTTLFNTSSSSSVLVVFTPHVPSSSSG
jgi:hypothetical protein